MSSPFLRALVMTSIVASEPAMVRFSPRSHPSNAASVVAAPRRAVGLLTPGIEGDGNLFDARAERFFHQAGKHRFDLAVAVNQCLRREGALRGRRRRYDGLRDLQAGNLSELV